MTVSVKLSYLRIAPRKVRLIADLIRGKRVDDAQSVLSFLPNKSAYVMLKLLKQAVSNAEKNSKIDGSNLYISKITVDAGPILKRSRPRARGSAYEIQKKTSHVAISFDEAAKDGGTKRKVTEKPETEKTDVVPEETTAQEEKVKKSPSGKIRPEREGKVRVAGAPKKIFRRQTF